MNINTAITRQLIRTARTLEAEWWKVCGEVWVRGQNKRGVKYWARLGCWISPCCGPFSLDRRFEIHEPSIFFFNFPSFFSGRGKPRIRGSART